MSLVAGVRVIGFLSILLSAGVVGVSSWMLYKTYNYRNETSSGSLTRFAGSVINDLGLSGKVQDPDLILRTKIGVSAAALAAGALQLITSLFLLFCSSSKGGRVSARLWLFVNLFVILTCGAAFVCLISQKYFQDEVTDSNRDRDHMIKAFLGITALDTIFLFFFSFVTGAFGCRSA